MYARLNNGAVEQYPFYIHTLRLENPNTSFPNNIEVDFDTLAEFNVVRVFPTAQPTFNPMAEKVVESTPAMGEDGRWLQVWTVVDLSPEELVAKVEESKTQVVNKVQERLDEFARTHNYDGILSAATYATSTIPKFAAEGQYAVVARDQTWAALYEILADIQSGNRPIPTNFEEIESELPQLAWPE
jgi:hypothetical protein